MMATGDEHCVTTDYEPKLTATAKNGLQKNSTV